MKSKGPTPVAAGSSERCSSSLFGDGSDARVLTLEELPVSERRSYSLTSRQRKDVGGGTSQFVPVRRALPSGDGGHTQLPLQVIGAISTAARARGTAGLARPPCY